MTSTLAKKSQYIWYFTLFFLVLTPQFFIQAYMSNQFRKLLFLWLLYDIGWRGESEACGKYEALKTSVMWFQHMRHKTGVCHMPHFPPFTKKRAVDGEGWGKKENGGQSETYFLAIRGFVSLNCQCFCLLFPGCSCRVLQGKLNGRVPREFDLTVIYRLGLYQFWIDGSV